MLFAGRADPEVSGQPSCQPHWATRACLGFAPDRRLPAPYHSPPTRRESTAIIRILRPRCVVETVLGPHTTTPFHNPVRRNELERAWSTGNTAPHRRRNVRNEGPHNGSGRRDTLDRRPPPPARRAPARRTNGGKLDSPGNARREKISIRVGQRCSGRLQWASESWGSVGRVGKDDGPDSSRGLVAGSPIDAAEGADRLPDVAGVRSAVLTRVGSSVLTHHRRLCNIGLRVAGHACQHVLHKPCTWSRCDKS